MMMKSLLPFLFAVGVRSEGEWFCHGINCPEFTNTSTAQGLEVRFYDSALWASTNVSSISLQQAESIGFNRLFDYISGANEAGTAIDMTAPVLTKVIPGAGPNCNSTFIVSFFTPFLYQTAAGPPAPTNPLVYLNQLEALTVAVSVFGGFQNQKLVLAEAAKLEAEVSTDSSVQADSSTYGDSWFVAGYDAPFKLTGRHNEIWLPVVM